MNPTWLTTVPVLFTCNWRVLLEQNNVKTLQQPTTTTFVALALHQVESVYSHASTVKPGVN